MSPLPRWAVGLAMLLLGGLPAAASALDLDPARACGLLAGEGLGAGPYLSRDGAPYACRSRRRTLPLGGRRPPEVRFLAHGDARAVHELRLTLDLYGRRDLQPALNRFARLAQGLLSRVDGGPADARLGAAIQGLVPGQWRRGALRYELRKILATGRPGMRLVLRLY